MSQSFNDQYGVGMNEEENDFKKWKVLENNLILNETGTSTEKFTCALHLSLSLLKHEVLQRAKVSALVKSC